MTMRNSRVLILGCGFTGKRVASMLLEEGAAVLATSRDIRQLQQLRNTGVEVIAFDATTAANLEKLTVTAARVDALVCSIPSIRVGDTLTDPIPEVVAAMKGKPARTIYLSTTGVYGRQHEIDEKTRPRAETLRERLRVEAENAVLSGFASPLVLRPAAIYGPGRGVHVSLREGKYRLTGDGSNYISRIHVDDLARHVVAALRSDVTGAWPVADERPCTQREMAKFCAGLLDVPMPPSAEPGRSSETLRANRKVDGTAIRQRLGIGLQYASYLEGVPAAIAEENRSGLIRHK